MAQGILLAAPLLTDILLHQTYYRNYKRYQVLLDPVHLHSDDFRQRSTHSRREFLSKYLLGVLQQLLRQCYLRSVHAQSWRVQWRW